MASKNKLEHEVVAQKPSRKKKRLAKSEKVKSAKIKYHHKKAYRKRYYSAAFLFTIGGLLLLAYILGYIISARISLQSARSYISQSLVKSESDKQASNSIDIKSTYGFGLLVDQNKYYATGLDKLSGQLFLGAELATNRAYNVVRVSPVWIDNQDNNVSISIEYKDDVTIQSLDEKTASSIEQALASSGVDKNAKTAKVRTNKQTIGGREFVVSDWERQSGNSIGASLTAHLTTMVAVVDGHPFVILVNKGFDEQNTTNGFLDDVIGSIYFTQRTQAKILPFVVPDATYSFVDDAINRMTFTDLAEAAGQQAPLSEVNSAKYSPAVVKIYNVFCANIKVEGLTFFNDHCSASTGSGFFLDKSGHIATNGHVVPDSPKDAAIYYAMRKLFQGNKMYLLSLMKLAGVTEYDLSSKESDEEALQFLLDELYGIDDSKFAMENEVINLLVCLNDEQPDVKELLDLTKKREKYPEQNNIKQATVLAQDYRLLDGITAWRASDVAVIKINGDNFPAVKLGSIDSVTQGANLDILGFPGQAVDNQLIGEGESKVTLTSGKVSSIKNAQGSDKRLIETTATIGHGNSGGPVLGDDGNVIGIATYTVDGSGKGDGVFNYIRDIKDLKSLIDSKSIKLNTEQNKTQVEWERGLELFYNARYSKSIKNFDKVKELYPQHPKVGEFVATAQQRIKDGQDVKDFPVVIVAVASVVVLTGAATTAFLMIRHKKAHNVYKAQVSTGAMQPLQPGAPAQRVDYNPAAVGTVNNPLNVPLAPTLAPVQQPPINAGVQAPTTAPQSPIQQQPQQVAPVIQAAPTAQPFTTANPATSVINPTVPQVVEPQKPNPPTPLQ